MSSKLRIGVWLACQPNGGGTFQCALTTLLALLELERRYPQRYEIICFSSTADWRAVLVDTCSVSNPDLRVMKLHVILKCVRRLAQRSNVLLHLWRRLNRHLPMAYRALRQSEVDLLICPAQDTLAYEVDVPVVSTIHDLMHRYESEFPESCSRKIFKFRERHYRSTCRFSRIVLVDSELGKRQVVESYGDSLNARVMVLPFLPPPYVLNHDPAGDDTQVGMKYQLPDQYIFYPAQFWSHKNHHRLLQAIRLLRDQGVVVHAVFAGAAKNNHARVTQLIEELNLGHQVRILGYVPDEDIVGLYRNATALIMPTFYGPTNIPIVEAFFLGVPVACSDIYAMPEQVGEAGLLFDPRSVTDMAEKIRLLWTDASLRDELIGRGYERVANMTVENHAEKWKGIIDAALRLPDDSPAHSRRVPDQDLSTMLT